MPLVIPNPTPPAAPAPPAPSTATRISQGATQISPTDIGYKPSPHDLTQRSVSGGVSGGGTTPGHAPAPFFNYFYISFAGHSTNYQGSFHALCADNAPPVVKGGYAKWDVLDRPLRRGVTIFKGYDPSTIEFSIIIAKVAQENDQALGWETDESAGNVVEERIQILEWMAGSSAQTGGVGQSALITVATYGARGETTGLLPKDFQGINDLQGANLTTGPWIWVFGSGIEWGKSYRSRHGSRVWQEAKFTLLEYSGYNQPKFQQQAGGYFVTDAGHRTVLQIAEADSSHAVEPGVLAQRIQHDPKNNPVTGTNIHLSRKSVRWPIPVGKSVWIPSHTV